ncbi:DUF1934 family protein [Fusobacterium sp. PH5-44]|uniref:DUF1934 family protein n=1 Tax=unclassified Fusobacterium TaxID=2648384 RepID=UPI003D1D3CC3
MKPITLLIKSTDNSKKIFKEKIQGYKHTCDNIITYEYESSLGKSMIIYHINTNHIVIKRNDGYDTQFSIHEKTHSAFTYKSNFIKFEFLVLGNNINFKNGELRFNYSLFTDIDDLKANRNIFNKIYMSIEEIT